MMSYSFTTLSLLLLSLFSIIAHCQHTTSPQFTPQPTSSAVFCIQRICPSPESFQPTCPSNCSSGCKMVPDQCCPQLTVAVCQDGSSSTGGSVTDTATSLPSASTMTSATSSSNGATPPPVSPSSSPAPNTNTGLILQPSLSILLVLASFILYLFSY